MQKSKQTHLPRARIRQVRLQADGAEAEAAAESRTASGSRPMAGRGPTNGRQAPRSIWLPVLRGGCRKTERAGLPYKRRCRKRGSQSRGYTGTAGGTETTKRRQVGALQIWSGRTSRPRCRPQREFGVKIGVNCSSLPTTGGNGQGTGTGGSARSRRLTRMVADGEGGASGGRRSVGDGIGAETTMDGRASPDTESGWTCSSQRRGNRTRLIEARLHRLQRMDPCRW